MATASDSLKRIIKASGLTLATFDKLADALGLELVGRKKSHRRKGTDQTGA
jgi:hypothetical protein